MYNNRVHNRKSHANSPIATPLIQKPDPKCVGGVRCLLQQPVTESR